MSRSSHRGFLGLIGLSLVMSIGCGSGARPQLPEERHLKALVVLSGQYRGSHRGQLPANVEVLKAFVTKASPDTLKTLSIEPGQTDALFVSTRDNKPFVYRPSTSAAPKMGADGKPVQHVLFHEAEGSGGKRWVAYELGGTELVDESKFAQLVPK
jgi:hypothetical protein